MKVFLIAVSAISIYLIVTTIVVGIIFKVVFHRRPPCREFMTFEDYRLKCGFEVKRFKLQLFGETLACYMCGEESSDKLLIFSHGIKCDAAVYATEIKYFAEHGFLVLSYDNIGSGESGGKCDVGLPQAVFTLERILSYARENFPDKEPVLYGHSWGGYASLAVHLLNGHGVKRVVAVSPFNSPAGVSLANGRKGFGIFSYLLYPAICINLFLKFGKKGFMSAKEGMNAAEGCKFIVIHGGKDKIIPLKQASVYRVRNKVTADAEFILLPDRGHTNCMLEGDAARLEGAFMEEVFRHKIKTAIYFDHIFDDLDREIFSVPDEELFARLTEFYNS